MYHSVFTVNEITKKCCKWLKNTKGISKAASLIHTVCQCWVSPMGFLFLHQIIFPLLCISPSLSHPDTEHHLLSAHPPPPILIHFFVLLHLSALLISSAFTGLQFSLQDTVLTQMLVAASCGVWERGTARNSEFDWQWLAWLAWILICWADF